jgi:para-nitrobenzyl esterase
MVFIHGGGFVTGAGSWYDGNILARKANAIVVTMNYRLGPFGFLAHSALTAEAADQSSGQYGLQDQQFSLQWVKDNIANFGGNPNNVTIFGESAGGVSVCALLASPKAAGLFHKAMIESGACGLSTNTLSSAETKGASWATAIGCSTPACLRSASVPTLLNNPANQDTVIGKGWLPAAGGTNSALPQNPLAAFAAGAFNNVPVLNGSNHDEWRLFDAMVETQQGSALTSTQFTNDANVRYGSNASAVLAQYPLSSYSAPDVAHATMVGDSAFICGARTTNRALVAKGVTVYGYEFNDPNAPMPGFSSPYMPLRAAHAAELSYIFRFAGYTLTTAQQAFSDQMIKYWANFAATGNPNGSGVPAWPAYTAANDTFQNLAVGAIAPITSFTSDHKCAFWSSIGY